MEDTNDESGQQQINLENILLTTPLKLTQDVTICADECITT